MPQSCIDELHKDNIWVPNSPHAPLYWGAAIFLIVAAFIICFMYRRQLKREAQLEMRKTVNAAVSQYIACREDGSNNKDIEGETSTLNED